MSTTHYFQVASVPTAVAGPPTANTPQEAEQKAAHKAVKKQRKQERLRFFYGWCSACKAFGSFF